MSSIHPLVLLEVEVSLVARGWRRESPSRSCAAQMGLVVQPQETGRCRGTLAPEVT